MKLNRVEVFNNAYNGQKHYSFSNILLIFLSITSIYLYPILEHFCSRIYNISTLVDQALIAELITDFALYYV